MELNIITPIKERHLCAVDYSTYIKVPVNINSTAKTIAIIDSRATGNFISERLVQLAGLPTKKKRYPYQLQVVDGSDLSGGVGEETPFLPVIIQRHYEEIAFNIVRMATHDIVLGIPWLKKHNPIIN